MPASMPMIAADVVLVRLACFVFSETVEMSGGDVRVGPAVFPETGR